MARTVVVTQSNYLPWRGYFDLIAQADALILLDDVQYTRRDWRNRNLIRTRAGTRWLTVPVEVSGLGRQSIDSVRTADPGWAAAHIAAITEAYRSANAFESEAPGLFALLEAAARLPLLSSVNEHLLRALCGKLAIATPISRSTDLIDRAELGALGASERLARLAATAGATRYLTGPAARAYLDVAPFEALGIEVAWMSYEGYPVYPQCWAGFEPKVSVLDLILNVGEAAPGYLVRTSTVNS